LDESLESVSFIHPHFSSPPPSALRPSDCVAVGLVEMNTDGHAKGYVFDGLHSHFPALPLIPIYGFFLLPSFDFLRTTSRMSRMSLLEGTERFVKYNFMGDSKYWSTLETSQMLNPYG
jgi:hypothetical protein